MTDAVTKQPLRVIPNEVGGPYLDVPGSQVDEVERLFKENGIFCWPDPHIISIDGGPEMGVINLGKNGDAAKAQAVLDRVP